MRKIKVINRDDVIKQKEEVFGSIEERIIEMVTGAMEGMKTSLEEELTGIPLVVMQTMMELEIEKVAGVKRKHMNERLYTRWGTNPGAVIINGKKVPTPVPRAVEKETKKAYRLKSYGLFRRASELVKRAYQDLIRGISTRRYREGVHGLLAGYGSSASTVSRRMIEATTEKVKELFERRLDELDLCVLMIDGVRVGNQTVVISLGIDTEGVKHTLGLWQGATENARVARKLMEELVERGMKTDRAMLVVIDGSKALRRAIEDVLGADTPVQRCTVHKRRNVLDELPEKYQREVSRNMTNAYRMVSAEDAQRELQSLANDLEKINPSAARSLREGLEEDRKSVV